ncbi:hypothetical protein E8E12_000679 [Didymella heteroderae]|uniref:Uncharacterized protein n=1 Tax=Didymella heteroderae TaxID=1769908 RepID=A0A9P5BVN6_9PLEO|nr:hypothetical protein E8E12_000679 [Didymella heteroderae]
MSGITKTVLQEGDTTQLVCKLCNATVEYRAWVKDEGQPDGKGVDARSGWDVGVLGTYTSSESSQKPGPMALNEKARFEFPPLYGFGRNEMKVVQISP